jgi:hypothetical protein
LGNEPFNDAAIVESTVTYWISTKDNTAKDTN